MWDAQTWATVGVALGGTVLACAALHKRGGPLLQTLLEAAAHGVALGAGCAGITLFLARFMGLPRPGVTAILIVGAVVLAGFVFVARRGARVPAPRSHAEGARLLQALGVILLLLAFAGGVAVAGDWGAERPSGGWDSMAVWNVKARTLFRHDGDWSRVMGDIQMGRPDYPLFVPATVAAQWSWMGEEAPFTARNTALMFLAALTIMVYAATARLAGRTLALYAAAAVAATPFIGFLSWAEYIDVPLGYMVLAAAAALASRVHSDPGRRLPGWFAGVLLGLVPWVKNEGTFLAAILFSSFALVALLRPRGERPRWKEVAGVAAGAALPALAVVLFKVGWAPEDPLVAHTFASMGSDFGDPSRWLGAARGFMTEFDPVQSRERWGILWVALGAGLLLSAGLRRPFRSACNNMLTLFVVGALLFYLLIFVLPPVPYVQSQEWFIRFGLKRLLVHLLPTIVLWICCLVAAADRSARTKA